MASYAILRFSKRKAGGVAATDRHNERKKSSYQSNPNIDMERSQNNIHFIKPNGTYTAVYKRMLTRSGCKARKDSTVVVETLITSSRPFLSGLLPEEVTQYFNHAFDFMTQKIGKENIISAVVHMDETTPHMHLSFCPITPDNRLSAKDILGNRAKLSKWQDEFHAHMVSFYPALQRGMSSQDTHRQHVPLWLFQQADRLETVYGEINQALTDIGMLNAGKKRGEALALLAAWVPDMTRLTAQIHGTEQYIESLERGQEELKKKLENQNDSLKNQVDEKLEELRKVQQEVFCLRETQRRYKRLLDQIPKDMIAQIKNKEKDRRVR